MSDRTTSHIKDNLAAIQSRIESACTIAGRSPRSVTLVAVSKNFSHDLVRAAYDLGVRDFGESKTQELQTKVHQLPKDINWHFIGKLQSNKAKTTAFHCHSIHSIENHRQVNEIAKQGRTIECYIQVNIASEPQKSGIFIQDLDKVLSYVLKCDQVRFRGLMTIGPAVSDPEESRVYFQKLAELNRLAGGTHLSMGMSSDFDVAIQEGSTHIRVGSAIFGNR